jgi:hypothetical protein
MVILVSFAKALHEECDMSDERLYPPSLTVEDGAHKLKVYTFGGVPRVIWNEIRDQVRAMPEVDRVDGAFDSGVAMWVTVRDEAVWGVVDPRILALIQPHLPAELEPRRIPFRGYPE